MSSKLILFYFIGFAATACREGEKKEYPPEPKIEFISAEPGIIKEGEKIIISFRYTDGDGDLGENTPDAKNLFITDDRLAITYAYRISALAPAGVVIPITGVLNAEITGVVITNNAQQQTVNYSIYITDRAGHSSNVIYTPPVTVNAP